MAESSPGAGTERDVALEGGELRLAAALKVVSTQTATILLIEDHRTTRRFLADNLAADGYEILEAESAGDAERMIASEFREIAILDLGLPDRDGLELLQEVRD